MVSFNVIDSLLLCILHIRCNTSDILIYSQILHSSLLYNWQVQVVFDSETMQVQFLYDYKRGLLA